MANTELGADSAHVTPQEKSSTAGAFMEAHRAWRYAKAKCDEVSYAWGRSIPDSVTEPLNIAARDTLDAFLLTPAPTINALAWKLRVFRDEDIADGWHLANEIVDCLYRDAERLADRHAMEATHG